MAWVRGLFGFACLLSRVWVFLVSWLHGPCVGGRPRFWGWLVRGVWYGVVV